MPLNPFGSLTREKCPECGAPLRFGVTTEVDEKTNSEICKVCKTVLGEKD